MDRGIWATWYDIPNESRERYLDWAHGTYLPFLKQVAGYAWVAHYRHQGGGAKMQEVVAKAVGHTTEDIGSGTQYLLLVGAPSPHTFFRPTTRELALPDGFGKMLALRSGVREVIFAEEARVNGPAPYNEGPGSVPGPAIQMGSFRMRTHEQEFELARWYAQFRMPYMAQMPGCISTRKLLGVAGWAKHGVLYEFESLEMRLKPVEEPHDSLSLGVTDLS